MLQFPEDYFKKEERCGFMVSEIMKRAWASQLEVLQRIIDICTKYGLTYYVYWGTLLGAVRHKGFIPWDDDLDIALQGEDYLKFLSVAKQELPEGYYVINMYTDNTFTNYFTRVTNGHEIDTREQRMAEYHGCPFAMGVDVFPLYYLPRDGQFAREQETILRFIGQLSRLVEEKEAFAGQPGMEEEIKALDLQIAKGMVDLEKVSGYTFENGISLRTQLTIVYDQICRLATEEESDAVTAFPIYLESGYLVEKELLTETMQVSFENIIVTIPKEYDAILRKNFKNYWQPKRNAAAHDYPFFKNQLELLGDKLELLSIRDRCGTENVTIHFEGYTSSKLDELALEARSVLPEEWWRKIYTVDEQGVTRRRKVILYYTGLGECLTHGERLAEKIEYVSRVFQDNPDVVLWWIPCSMETPSVQLLSRMAPGTVEEFRLMSQRYKEQDFGIYDDSGDIGRAITWSDAFYGDEGPVCSYYKKTNKPMMCQDYEVLSQDTEVTV